MPTEQTPLVNRHDLEMPKVVGLKSRSWIYTLCSVPYAACRWHGVSIVAAVVSALLCWLLGFAKISIFDPLIFKSIFVVFGFAIGFRNARANQRRAEAEAVTHELFAAAWSLLVVFPSDSRPKVREALLYLLEAIAQHVTVISDRHLYRYGIIGLRPLSRENESWWDCGHRFRPPADSQTSLSPRALMVVTLNMFEEEFERLNPSKSLVLRTFHQQSLLFKNSFNRVITLAMPSVSDRLIMLINFCLFMFAISLPWGIESNQLNFHRVWGPAHPHDRTLDNVMYSFSAGGFKVLNTFVCTTVLFGLNALAHEHEDPFGDASDDIDIHTLVVAFKKAVENYEERRAAAEQGKVDLSAEELVAHHHFICANAKAVEV